MTAITTTECRLTVLVETRAHLEPRLESAMAKLLSRAMIQRDRGIMVTRHSPNKFILELHPGVPFGMTQESDAS